VKLRVFAVRPFAITFFVALSIVSTALGESSVPRSHEVSTPTTESSPPVAASNPPPQPAPSPQAVTEPPGLIGAVLALREELNKLPDNALIDLLRKGPRPNLDRSGLEDNLKRVAAFDADRDKDAALRKRLLDAFEEVIKANRDGNQKPEDLLSLAISDVLKARLRGASQASPSATATPSGAGLPFRTPTPQPTLTPTVFDLLKDARDLLKAIEAQRKQEEDLAKNLRESLGQGAGGGGEGSGSGGDSGGGVGSGGDGAGNPDHSASKRSDSPSKKNRSSDSPLAKNESKTNPPPVDVSPASSSQTKKEDQKREPLDLGLKKTLPPAEPKPKANPVAMPTPLVPDVKNPSVPVVAKRSANDFGPSEPLNQPIAAAQSELPADNGAGAVGGVGGFGGGAAAAGAVSGGGGSLGGDGVLNVGNFPPTAGGGGPYTYIKTGPGDWLQAGGGGGEVAFTAFGGGAADYEEPKAPKTATPNDQILRVVALEPVGVAAGVRGARGVAGIGAAAGSAAHGVFSQRPTVTELCALGRMALCENPKRFATRRPGGGLGR
jgi:uncharacterized membrane protein YgcG